MRLRALPAVERAPLLYELNLRALKMLRPGGVLVTCSCSFHVGQTEFMTMLTDAAQDAHRELRVLETRAQAKDHPVVLTIPETFLVRADEVIE